MPIYIMHSRNIQMLIDVGQIHIRQVYECNNLLHQRCGLGPILYLFLSNSFVCTINLVCKTSSSVYSIAKFSSRTSLQKVLKVYKNKALQLYYAQ